MAEDESIIEVSRPIISLNELSSRWRRAINSARSGSILTLRPGPLHKKQYDVTHTHTSITVSFNLKKKPCIGIWKYHTSLPLASSFGFNRKTSFEFPFTFLLQQVRTFFSQLKRSLIFKDYKEQILFKICFFGRPSIKRWVKNQRLKLSHCF